MDFMDALAAMTDAWRRAPSLVQIGSVAILGLGALLIPAGDPLLSIRWLGVGARLLLTGTGLVCLTLLFGLIWSI